MKLPGDCVTVALKGTHGFNELKWIVERDVRTDQHGKA